MEIILAEGVGLLYATLGFRVLRGDCFGFLEPLVGASCSTKGPKVPSGPKGPHRTARAGSGPAGSAAPVRYEAAGAAAAIASSQTEG